MRKRGRALVAVKTQRPWYSFESRAYCTRCLRLDTFQTAAQQTESAVTAPEFAVNEATAHSEPTQRDLEAKTVTGRQDSA
jgi:hypothetical protein